MCSQDNNQPFGAPRGSGIVGNALSRMQPSAPKPAAPRGIIESIFAASGNAPPQPRGTGLARLTPSARGPRNRRRGAEF